MIVSDWPDISSACKSSRTRGWTRNWLRPTRPTWSSMTRVIRSSAIYRTPNSTADAVSKDWQFISVVHSSVPFMPTLSSFQVFFFSLYFIMKFLDISIDFLFISKYKKVVKCCANGWNIGTACLMKRVSMATFSIHYARRNTVLIRPAIRASCNKTILARHLQTIPGIE